MQLVIIKKEKGLTFESVKIFNPAIDPITHLYLCDSNYEHLNLEYHLYRSREMTDLYEVPLSRRLNLVGGDGAGNYATRKKTRFGKTFTYFASLSRPKYLMHCLPSVSSDCCKYVCR